jgi:hypothetical protein
MHATTMNLRRGLFRLWVVFAAVFVIAVGVTSSGGIGAAFEQASIRKDVITGGPMVPVDCANARGFLWTDYWKEKEDHQCWYPIARYRELYGAYKELDDDALVATLYEKAGMPRADSLDPWIKLVETAAVAVGAPLAVLVLGWSLIWAISGFFPAAASSPPPVVERENDGAAGQET